MYDWSQVKLRSLESILRRIFKKLDVCLKFHKNENALFWHIFKITSHDTMLIYSYKAYTPCLIGHR